MRQDTARDWLQHLGAAGDRVATAVFGYDRLAPDWRLTFPNGLPEHLVYLFVAGTVSGDIRAEPVALSGGSLLWLPPHTPFRLHATGDTGPMLYRFRLASVLRVPGPYLIQHDAWILRPTVDAIVTELGSRLEFRSERLRALLVVLFTAMFRAGSGTRRTAPLAPAVRERLETYVDTHLSERPSVPELAEIAGLSVDYFVRRFRETFGLPPRAWLVHRRIHQAMLELDESAESISRIAQRLAYPDVFLFSRQFKNVTGMSPRSWRERSRPQ